MNIAACWWSHLYFQGWLFVDWFWCPFQGLRTSWCCMTRGCYFVFVLFVLLVVFVVFAVPFAIHVVVVVGRVRFLMQLQSLAIQSPRWTPCCKLTTPIKHSTYLQLSTVSCVNVFAESSCNPLVHSPCCFLRISRPWFSRRVSMLLSPLAWHWAATKSWQRVKYLGLALRRGQFLMGLDHLMWWCDRKPSVLIFLPVLPVLRP